MTHGGLFSGFEAHRVLKSEDIENALRDGIIVLDTNVLLSLYRYTDKTVDDILRVLSTAGDRLFIPHQVVREFWRNRQSVISGLGSASKEARDVLTKSSRSAEHAIKTWAKTVALPTPDRDRLLSILEDAFDEVSQGLEDSPAKISAATPTANDALLCQIEELLSGRVGTKPDESAWEAAVAEGDARARSKTPPGYMDIEKESPACPREPRATTWCGAKLSPRAGKEGSTWSWSLPT